MEVLRRRPDSIDDPTGFLGAEQSSPLWPHLHSLGTPYTKPPQVTLKIICLLRHTGQHALDMLCSDQELRWHHQPRQRTRGQMCWFQRWLCQAGL